MYQLANSARRTELVREHGGQAAAGSEPCEAVNPSKLDGNAQAHLPNKWLAGNAPLPRETVQPGLSQFAPCVSNVFLFL